MAMAADVSYLVRVMKEYKEEDMKAKSTALITRDLLGGCSAVDSKELDLDMQVPVGYEKRLDLKVRWYPFIFFNFFFILDIIKKFLYFYVH